MEEADLGLGIIRGVLMIGLLVKEQSPRLLSLNVDFLTRDRIVRC